MVEKIPINKSTKTNIFINDSSAMKESGQRKTEKDNHIYFRLL